MASNNMPQAGRPVQILPSAEYARSGVYFLHHNGEVVYVGQAADMRKRIGNHLSEGIKQFDSVSCIACDLASLSSIERYYIAVLSPRYNRCSLSKQIKGLVDAGFTNAPKEIALDVPSGMVNPEQAAAYLGVEVTELDALVDKGLVRASRLVGRQRKRVEAYRVDDLREFASHLADA